MRWLEKKAVKFGERAFVTAAAAAAVALRMTAAAAAAEPRDARRPLPALPEAPPWRRARAVPYS